MAIIRGLWHGFRGLSLMVLLAAIFTGVVLISCLARLFTGDLLTRSAGKLHLES